MQACYSTWSTTYYDDYCGGRAPYPPVHHGLIRGLLVEASAKTVVDAGCGPASLLRALVDLGVDPYGFDLAPEMVGEAKRVLGDLGLPAARVWQGSVCDPGAFRDPAGLGPQQFDAALCIGVLPHVRQEDEDRIFANLRTALKPGGLAVLGARNELFSLFTMNRYTYQFMTEQLIGATDLKQAAGEQAPDIARALEQIKAHLRMDLPPVRTGKSDEPGYDEVLSRLHNPLVLPRHFAQAGFADVRVLFYHFHCLPPMFEAINPELFRDQSLALEDPTQWRGHFMASAFLVAGCRT